MRGTSDVGRFQATLGSVARSLGTEFISVVEMPADTEKMVSVCVLYDATERAASHPGAIALAIGLSPSGKHAVARIRELAGAGYVAVVYKCNGASDLALREAAHDFGLALFRAHDSVPWRQIAEILDGAVVAHLMKPLRDIGSGNLFDLANSIAAQAGGAVAIVDPEQTILAYSTLPEQPIDETRRDGILRLHVPHSVQTDLDYRRVHACEEPLEVACEDARLRRTAIAIRAGNTVLGSLWLLQLADQHRGEANHVLREAAQAVALHLLYKRTSEASGLTRGIEAVMPLLFEPGQATAAAAKLGIHTSTMRIAALTVSLPETSLADVLQIRLRLFEIVRNACALWLPSAVCGLSEHVVYLVVPQSPVSREFQRGAVQRIVQNARRVLSYPVLAGVGGEAPIDQLQASRIDAERILDELVYMLAEGCLAADSPDVVADMDSVGPRLHLRQIGSTLGAAGLLPGIQARRISTHDAAHNKSFGETIYAYLNCGGNAIEAAALLNVHVNTVRYRLAQVKSDLDIDLGDPETRLLVWLQLWAQHNQR